MDKYSTQSVTPSQPVAYTGPAIEMIDLCKDFGSFRAVDHLSLTVQQGEIFGLIGPDGAGKTSVFQILGGVMPATSGEISTLRFEPSISRHFEIAAT